MDQLTTFEALEVGKTYKETSSDYYLAKCLHKDPKTYNDGLNVYFKLATFEITTKTGRKVETIKKKFFIN